MAGLILLGLLLSLAMQNSVGSLSPSPWNLYVQANEKPDRARLVEAYGEDAVAEVES